MNSKKSILITVDVEDWFQVENFKPWIPYSTWPERELRVEKNTHKLLDIFDMAVSALKPVKATFFTLGWIAERMPHMIREIHARGHEVASHGYYHKRCDRQPAAELKQDLTAAKKILEDILGSPVYGYRAPNFSINNDVLNIIQDCGYQYDSSYNSFGLHGRYGRLTLPGGGSNGSAVKITDDFYEIPVSNLKTGTRIIPLGGGGYFRLIPFSLFKQGVKKILQQENAYIFYMHPWEIDPAQPRVRQASAMYKFRHYINLRRTASRLSKFIQAFSRHSFLTCHRYIHRRECKERRENNSNPALKKSALQR